MKSLTLSPLILFFFLLLTIGAASPGVYFYVKYKASQEMLANPDLASQEEAKSLKDKVGQFIAVPDDEIPTIMTVADREKLDGQPFFAKAKNGDKVLLFHNAKKAILFDPLANKILEVGPIIVSTPTASASAKTQTYSISLLSPTPIEPDAVKVMLLNGTQKTGITRTVEEKLASGAAKLAIVGKDFAVRRDYPTTIVIDLTGQRSNETQTLAETIGATVSELPIDETKPTSADILIIVGNDQT